MKALSIRTKLFIAFLLACLLSLGAVMLIFKYTVTDAFSDYLHQQDNEQLSRLETGLLDYYRQYLSWDELRADPRNLFPFVMRRERGRPQPPPPVFLMWFMEKPQNELERLGPHSDGQRGGGGTRVARIMERTVLLDQNQEVIWRPANQSESSPKRMRQLVFQDQVIGYLGMYPNDVLSDRLDREFQERIDYLLWVSALVALIMTALFSFLLARQLVKPIQKLRHATTLLTDGEYGLQMPVTSRDELGQLTEDFNELSTQLKENEGARKQWIMDIAHELRTPLSILRGEIEAIQDGINEPNEDTINSLHQETLHLNRLVDDLYTLSMSDSGALSYHKKPLDLGSVLNETLAQFAKSLQDQGINLTTSLPTRPCMMQGDEQRLQQLFQNIIKNTLRYTDAPGTLQVTLTAQPHQATIKFNDSAPGVPPEALPKLFDRLYRVEASRNRATGGAGIGLSISYNIVHAHNGQISAHPSALGGLEIVITLPLLN